MEQANDSLDKTTDSLTRVDDMMSKRTKMKKVKRFACFFVAFFLSIFLVLLFSLPCFQLRGMDVSGLINFEKSDIIALTGYPETKLNLLLSATKAQNNVVNTSYGLIKFCEINNNGIVSSCVVKEDYPVCLYKGVSYLSNGDSLDDALSKIDSLTIDENSKDRIRSNFSSVDNLKLPEIHLPENIDDDLEHAKQCFNSLSNIPLKSLNTFVGLQFVNNAGDSNFSNVCRALLKDGENYYLIDNILSSWLYPFFSYQEYPENVFLNIRNKIKNTSALSKIDFHFARQENVYRAYHFKLSKNNQNGNIILSTVTEE